MRTTVIVRAWNAEGYHRDILVVDGQQVRSHDDRVTDGREGPLIDPKQFPEMDRFEVVIKRD